MTITTWASSNPHPGQRCPVGAAAVGLAAAVVLSGCGGPAVPTDTGGGARPTPVSPAAGAAGSKRSTAIHVRYESVVSGGDADGVTMILDEIVDGPRLRTTQRDKSDPGRVLVVIVWDGHVMLLEEPGAGPPTRIVNPPADQRPLASLIRPGDVTFKLLCPNGRASGHTRIAGRAGTVYTCPAHTVGGEPVERSQLTLDDETGLTLRRQGGGSDDIAVEVTMGVTTDATTFSTELPAGVTAPAPLTNVDSVPRVGGGTLQMADLRHGPSLVVIGDLKGIRAMLAIVLPATSNGSRPRVYGLMNAIPEPDWKGSLDDAEDSQRFVNEVSAQAGTMPAPVGIDIKGGAAGEDLRTFEQIMAGTTVLAAIDTDGSLAWRMTDSELASSRKQLLDWIANTS